MSFREKFRLFLPPVYYKCKAKIKGEPKLIESPLNQIEKHTDKIILIGNGPSLNDTLAKYQDEILKYDRMAVNFFASSPTYDVLKPNLYLFADPAFFFIPENQKGSMEALFDAMISKTTWPLMLFIPERAQSAPMVGRLIQNNYINICYYRTDYQDIGKMPLYQAWDKNYLIPHFQNVLNVGVYLSLFWGYKETYLIGADTSSLEDIRVDQETNELFSVDTHFYKNDKIYNDKNLFDAKRGRIRSDWTLHGYIYAFGRMFEDYYELRKYADYKGLKVYNASEYSWINCFERKKLSLDETL